MNTWFHRIFLDRREQLLLSEEEEEELNTMQPQATGAALFASCRDCSDSELPDCELCLEQMLAHEPERLDDFEKAHQDLFDAIASSVPTLQDQQFEPNECCSQPKLSPSTITCQ